MLVNKFLELLPWTEQLFGGSTRSLAYTNHIKQFGLNKFLVPLPGIDDEFKINILTKKGFTNLDSFFFFLV